LSNSNPAGGSGGGYIFFKVGDVLTIDGRLNVDGAPGASTHGGSGGSGGSISIFARLVLPSTILLEAMSSFLHCPHCFRILNQNSCFFLLGNFHVVRSKLDRTSFSFVFSVTSVHICLSRWLVEGLEHC